MREKISQPRYLRQFVSQFNPAKQYQNIWTLSDPPTLQSPKQRKRFKRRIRTALIAAAFLTKGKIASHNKFSNTNLPPTIYMSQQEKELPIVINSRASFSVMPKLDNFLGPIEQCSMTELSGLNSKIDVVGQGTIKWKIQDVFASIHIIKCQVYYVPDAMVCLFLPQTAFQLWQKGSLFKNKEKTQLTLTCGTTLEFPIMMEAIYRSCSLHGISSGKTLLLVSPTKMRRLLVILYQRI
jgi:hypothetical protein